MSVCFSTCLIHQKVFEIIFLLWKIVNYSHIKCVGCDGLTQTLFLIVLTHGRDALVLFIPSNNGENQIVVAPWMMVDDACLP